MVSTVATPSSKTLLAAFLADSMGSERAREVANVIEASLALGDKQGENFPKEPIGEINRLAIVAAISAATELEVSEIRELSLSKPLIEVLGAAFEAMVKPPKLGDAPWLLEVLSRRIDRLVGFCSSEAVIPLNRFLHQVRNVVSMPAEAYRNIVAGRLGLDDDSRFSVRIQDTIRQGLYYYVASRFVGNEEVAAQLEQLVQMLPLVTPICAMDGRKDCWIVIVP